MQCVSDGQITLVGVVQSREEGNCCGCNDNARNCSRQTGMVLVEQNMGAGNVVKAYVIVCGLG